jgi:hypothetical protein
MPACGLVEGEGRLLGPKTAGTMTSRTHFLVVPFFRTTEGDLVADEPIEVTDPARARRQAERVARATGGAVAFSRTGDPAIGAYQDAVILGCYGEVPEDLAEFTRG